MYRGDWDCGRGIRRLSYAETSGECRGDWDCGRGIVRLSFAGGECRGGCTKGTCMQSWAVAITDLRNFTTGQHQHYFAVTCRYNSFFNSFVL